MRTTAGFSALLLVLALAGQASADPAPPQAAPLLTDTAWEVTGYNNGRQAVVSVRPGTVLTLAFGTDGRLSGSAGCNPYRTAYAIVGDRFSTGKLAASRRLCTRPDGVMDQEAAFLRALERTTGLRLDGDRLELHAGDGARQVIAVRSQPAGVPGEKVRGAAGTGRADASLTDTYWRILRLGETRVEAAAGRREPHLVLRSGGTRSSYVATVGCNRLTGGYAVDGEMIGIAAAASTRMACPPPVDALEQTLLEVLSRAARWRIAADHLELLDTSGTVIAAFEAVYL
jgi:heat shock protein HslJ